ncbi:MAG: hypothetical protein H6853_05245 [Rhodospirillales bacterium]|nr:hypothetical protein [Alphaproteobacteria bacterium]USO02956.1 MAG: hypothetical protein H6853_05245 [Rhodospirillales bacterium]
MDVVRTAVYIADTPSRLGKSLGEAGISEAGKTLTQAHLNLNAQPGARTLESCVTSYAAEKALPYVGEGKMKTLTEKFASAGQCDVDQWTDALPLEVANRGKSMVIEAAGTGASQVVDFVGSAGAAQQAHKDTIETLSRKGFPGMMHGTVMAGRDEYEYHVDASGAAGHDGEGGDAKIYLEPTDHTLMGGDEDKPNTRALMRIEEGLKSAAIGSVHDYEQNGGDYAKLVEETSWGDNDYLTSSPETGAPEVAQNSGAVQKAAFLPQNQY